VHSDEVCLPDGEQFIFHELADDSKKHPIVIIERIMISDERFFLLDTVSIKVFYCDMIILLNQLGVKGLEMMS
jgi:hypothetical protein